MDIGDIHVTEQMLADARLVVIVDRDGLAQWSSSVSAEQAAKDLEELAQDIRLTD